MASTQPRTSTQKFVTRYFGRVFADPASIFTEEMLRPELQDKESFADGLSNIIETQRKVAKLYFEDESFNYACPPLKALLKIMANPKEEKNLRSLEVRSLFDSENLINSDWYRKRIEAKCKVDQRLWEKHYNALKNFNADSIYNDEQEKLNIPEKIISVKENIAATEDSSYPDSLIGTIGVDPTVI